MPRAQSCLLNGKLVDVDYALRLRDDGAGVRIDFRCQECGQAVVPHKESGYGAAHFEHLRKNPTCSLSEPA